MALRKAVIKVLHAIALGCGLMACTAAAAAPAGSSEWEFSITPYGWFSGLNGDVGIFPSLRPVHVDASFSDILDNLDFAAMAIFQARKGRFVSMVDLAYVDLSVSKGLEIRNRDFISGNLESSTLTGTAVAGYRLVDKGQFFFDVMAGLRLSSADTDLSLAGPRRSISDDISETWVDPVIAARFHTPLGENWAFVIYGDMGGFGASSDFTWQVQGAVQYRLGDGWWLSGGWRHYAVDFEDDGFLYDVSMSGPILGISYRF